MPLTPGARLGSYDSAGNRLYRAYFIADFVWHTALTAELTKHAQPPRNPYLASKPVHYYWTYFVVPATIALTTAPCASNVITSAETPGVVPSDVPSRMRQLSRLPLNTTCITWSSGLNESARTGRTMAPQ